MTPEKREAAIKWLTDEIRSLRMAPAINGCGPENWAEQLEVMETCLEAVRGYSPTHIGREAWEKPCSMCGGKTTLYQHTNTTKLFMNTFGEAATLVAECMACPPYADCCMKGISANSAFKINFCPECGRPLTPEAWAMMEKRLRG